MWKFVGNGGNRVARNASLGQNGPEIPSVQRFGTRPNKTFHFYISFEFPLMSRMARAEVPGVRRSPGNRHEFARIRPACTATIVIAVASLVRASIRVRGRKKPAFGGMKRGNESRVRGGFRVVSLGDVTDGMGGGQAATEGNRQRGKIREEGEAASRMPLIPSRKPNARRARPRSRRLRWSRRTPMKATTTR